MGIDRSAWKLTARWFAWATLAVIAALGLGTGCANQTPVIPMLTVQPNAGARIFYFERRAQAMFGKGEGEGEGEVEVEVEVEGDEVEGAEGVARATPCAPRTWGVEPAERTSCDPR